jgi:formate dehydrogenase (NADP+) beta subunit
VSLDGLFDEGHDAVLVAVGAHRGQKLRIPGAVGDGVLVSTDFLRAVNVGESVDVGKKVVVVGGGNVAFDCARVALRLGAREVSVACLECRADMPAGGDEILQAEGEGIRISPARSPVRILREDGRVTGAELLEVEGFSFDEDGVAHIETIAGSEHVVETDTVIFAVGQAPEIPEWFGIDTTARGLVELDPFTLSTNREGVFAAGDAVAGSASVIRAIASGRKAAVAIDKFLGGSGRIDRKLAPRAEMEPRLGREEGFAALARSADSCVVPEDLVDNFCEVVGVMKEDDANHESSRCLQCDLRLTLQTVKFWGSY